MENVVITGVSTGIGYAIARLMLQKGFRVFGISRTAPADLLCNDNFIFTSIDVSQKDNLLEKLSTFFIKKYDLKNIKYLFLNAGLFGQRITTVHKVPASEINYVMDVNVWSNKSILDLLLGAGVTIEICVVSSSIAGVRARAGNSAYAISKATLNMLMKLYALECPQVFFAVLGLCNVDTFLSRTILSLPLEGNFPENEKLRLRGKTSGYVVSPEKRADDIYQLLQSDFRHRILSGEFTEIRSLVNE